MTQQLSLELIDSLLVRETLSSEVLKEWIKRLPNRTRVGYRQKKNEKQCFVTTYDRNDKESLSVVIKISDNKLINVSILEDGSISVDFNNVNQEALEMAYQWIMRIV